MGRKIKCLFMAALSFVLCSCSYFKEELPQQSINDRLQSMVSYEATGTLIRIDEKGKWEYTVRQCWQNDGKYRLEILEPEKYNGNYTVFNGNEVIQYNPSVKDSVIRNVPESVARNQIFVGAFVKNYFNSENVSCVMAELDESKCTVLEAVIPGNNKYTATEKLWVDNESFNPVKLVLYDSDGNEKYIMEFDSFQYDVEFDENTFEAAQ